MKKKLIIGALVSTSILLVSFSCTAKIDSSTKIKNENVMNNGKENEIYFAGGCFWGTEHFFKQVRGVTSTTVGYANGRTENPSYKNVVTGETGFAERRSCDCQRSFCRSVSARQIMSEPAEANQ